MKIGYSYWGYLGDVKFDLNGNLASTPDGNAFYSWSIINKLQEDGHEVFGIMPDRDRIGFNKLGRNLFGSWCNEQRNNAYAKIIDIWSGSPTQKDGHYSKECFTKEIIFEVFKLRGVDKLDVILHEWRMPIKGRNYSVKDETLYQPDLDIQYALIEFCAEHNIKLIIFDLDYKINVEELRDFPNSGNNIYVFELGHKWQSFSQARHVEIPFDFRYIYEFPPIENYVNNNLVYVGNRYERDWCIDKYIPTEIKRVMVYGNWLESNRNSQDKWPNINFGKRIQTSDMRMIYGHSKATILLAKKEYLKNSFMTARILEAVFYGCVPLFIEEYGEETIKKYGGKLGKYLTVRDKADVIDKVYALEDDNIRIKTIKYLRDHLKFMDVSNFVKEIYEII